MAEAARQEHPLVVLTNPSWSFDQDNYEPMDFFTEARITDESIKVLRSRFQKFASGTAAGVGSVGGGSCAPSSTASPVNSGSSGASGAQAASVEGLHMTLRDFRRLNQHYAICRPETEDSFFRAMGRNTRERLSFHDFLLGCSAASPATPHILNSLTGFVRARYIFDFYNASRSGTLDIEELAWLLADARRHLGEGPSRLQKKHLAEVAQELGEVSAVTLRVTSPQGKPLCDVRASTRWTGLRVRRELARRLELPGGEQKLSIGNVELAEDLVLERLIPAGAGSVEMIASVSWEGWPVQPELRVSDDITGVERLVHIPFEAFYKALVAEQLRGMSRLFRFRRQLFHASRSGTLSSALVGGA